MAEQAHTEGAQRDRHLPPKLECSVLIMHGQQDNRMPVGQAVKLADALRERGAKVETHYFPHGVARPRQARRARTARLPARQPARHEQRRRLGKRLRDRLQRFEHFFGMAIYLHLGEPRRTTPALSMMNVVRSVPMNSRPYSDFILYTPYSLQTLLPGSASSGKFSSCLAMNLPCDSVESALMPTTFAPSFLIWRDVVAEAARLDRASGGHVLRIESGARGCLRARSNP